MVTPLLKERYYLNYIQSPFRHDSKLTKRKACEAIRLPISQTDSGMAALELGPIGREPPPTQGGAKEDIFVYHASIASCDVTLLFAFYLRMLE